MMDLETTIRTRVAHQMGIDGGQRRNLTLGDSLDQAIWIYGDYGLTSRMGAGMRSPMKRLRTENRVRIPVGRAYRVFSTSIAALLYPGFQTPVEDQELVDAVPTGGISRQQLADTLGMTIRKLNYRIRKEQNNWQLLKHDDTIYRMDDFLGKTSDRQPITTRVLEILRRYPYCTVDQIEHFTGLDRSQLAGPIAQLAVSEQIIRGLTRLEAPDEMFCLPDQVTADNFEEFPVFVLEKRDALVEMIKLERYFEHENADYWIFIDGIPQAEFDLDKESRTGTYSVTNLNRFVLTTYELGDILSEITTWGRTQQLRIEVDQIDDPITTTFKSLTNLLLDRGYQLENESLILDRHENRRERKFPEESTQEEEESRPDILDWHLLGPWCKNRQFLDFEGTTAELLYYLGQLDDARSIAYRLQKNPQQLDFEDVVYIPGINHRMGFVHRNQVEDIIRGWPTRVKFSFLDKKIQAVLETPKTTAEIIEAINESPVTVKQRLRYLESSRVIRKQLPGSLDMNSCLWILFDEGLDDYKKPIGGKRAMASVGTFLLKVLENNPPLTKSQLSRYLGMTTREIAPLIKQFLRTNKIIEGYFIADTSDIQYSVPDVLDTIQPRELDEEEHFAAVNRVDILPLSDPFALLHLPPLVMEDPSIQPTQRLDELAEQWMIMWDGQPVGYMIKQPTSQQLLDYELDVKITESMITTPIIAGALQKIVSLFRTWYGDEGKIKTINNTLASDPYWKDIHFLIESIGIRMEQN